MTSEIASIALVTIGGLMLGNYIISAYLRSRVKYARVKVTMDSGAVEYGNLPYSTKAQLEFMLAHLARAKHRKAVEGNVTKIVADTVKEIQVVHENWPKGGHDGNQD